MKSTIVVIITRAEIGGAQNYVFSFIEQLKSDFNFIVYCGSEGFLTEKLNNIKITTKTIPSIDSPNMLLAVSRIRAELKKDKPELVNMHSTLASVYGRLASTGLNLKTIFSVHGWFFANNATLSRRILGPFIEKLCGKLTNHWITETHFDQDVGFNNAIIPNNQKVTVIYNGIQDLGTVKQWQSNQLEKIKKIAFIGRVSRQKNPLLAIEVMACLPDEFHLTLFCDNAADTELNQAIEKLHLSKRVELIDTVFNTAEIINNYDTLLVTSRYEGMPLCMLEAMSAGLPIVTSNVCGLKELVINGENGYVVNEIASAKNYAEMLVKVFESNDSAISLGKSSRQRFLEHHTLNKMSQQLRHTFKNTITHKKE